MTITQVMAALVLSGLVAVADAGAQATRGVALEGVAGWAGYVDDATIEHALVGASVRVPLTERLSAGPEVVFTDGPGRQRNLYLLGTLWFDLVAATPTTRVVPFLVAGGGYERRRDVVDVTSGEASFTAGGGARVRLGEHVHVGGDVRIGWELHLRFAGHVGVTWPRH